MIDIEIIREKPEKVAKALVDRGVMIDIYEVAELDKKRRVLLSEIDGLNARLGQFSKKPTEREIKELRAFKDNLSEKKSDLVNILKHLNELLLEIPNMPHKDVPVGKDESANKVLREWGEKPKLGFEPKDYLEIAEKYDWIDTKRAAKISGSRFGFLKGEAALFELKLVNMTVELLVGEGFIFVIPPVMVLEETMHQTGHLSKNDAKEKYFIPEDKLYLVGSSEQSILPMHSGEVFEEKDLPRRYVGFSTCFRREAGSYGKDTKGILRVHQFDKVEMISYVKPENSEKELEYLVSLQERIMQKLGLPYRVVANSTGDMGVTASHQFDIETWFPEQSKYRETHSASNCTDYQTRRLNIKYKKKSDGKNEYVHALNATAITARAIIATIENFQTSVGSVKFPL